MSTPTFVPSARTVDARQQAASTAAHAIASALIDAAGVSDSATMTARWRDLTARVGVPGAVSILRRELANHGVHEVTFTETHGDQLPGYAPTSGDPAVVREALLEQLPVNWCGRNAHHRPRHTRSCV